MTNYGLFTFDSAKSKCIRRAARYVLFHTVTILSGFFVFIPYTASSITDETFTKDKTFTMKVCKYSDRK